MTAEGKYAWGCQQTAVMAAQHCHMTALGVQTIQVEDRRLMQCQRYLTIAMQSESKTDHVQD